jgi:hypothetical protein
MSRCPATSFVVGVWMPMLSSRCRLTRRWAWRQLARCPILSSAAKHVFHGSSIRKDIVPCYPCFVPCFAIHFQTLDVECGITIATRRSNLQTLSVTKTDSHLSKPRRQNEESRLSRYRVESNHLPLVDRQYNVFVKKDRDY